MSVMKIKKTEINYKFTKGKFMKVFTENIIINPILLQGVEIKQETKKAIFVKYFKVEVWIPLSQIEWFDKRSMQIKASEWILKKHKLI